MPSCTICGAYVKDGSHHRDHLLEHATFDDTPPTPPTLQVIRHAR